MFFTLVVAIFYIILFIIDSHCNFSHCKKRNVTGHAHFFSWCHFMMALGKPKLHTKFEVASLSFAEILKGNRKNLGSSPRPGRRPLIFCMGFYDGPW